MHAVRRIRAPERPEPLGFASARAGDVAGRQAKRGGLIG
jgi:hypothetical protein